MWSRQAHDWERCRGFKCRRCDALNAACYRNESYIACTAPFCTRVYPRVSFLHTMSVRIIEHPTARRDEWKMSHAHGLPFGSDDAPQVCRLTLNPCVFHAVAPASHACLVWCGLRFVTKKAEQLIMPFARPHVITHGRGR